DTPTLSLFLVTALATTVLYTLSLHDALPISKFWRTDVKTAKLMGFALLGAAVLLSGCRGQTSRKPPLWIMHGMEFQPRYNAFEGDRKSTRLNSSHVKISYAVFCLKTKKKLYS